LIYKKGTIGDQTLVVLFLANVVVIGFGIWLGVSIYYGEDLDYRLGRF
jgi:hypothetical protein